MSKLNEKKISQAHSDLIEVFQKHKLSIGEILVTYGNLGYTLGASIAGYKDTGPSIEDLKKKYYESPTVGVALMLQGVQVTTWYDDIKQQPKEEEKK